MWKYIALLVIYSAIYSKKCAKTGTSLTVSLNTINFTKGSVTSPKFDLSDYEVMTKEELIKELVKSKVNELRLKKGYTVEGAGVEKVFLPLNNKNIK
mgnify:CR=1 FL=1